MSPGPYEDVLPQGHAADVFEAYTQLLTEMVLRLPYQIKKIADTSSRIPPPVFDHSWFYFLSEVIDALSYSVSSQSSACPQVLLVSLWSVLWSDTGVCVSEQLLALVSVPM